MLRTYTVEESTLVLLKELQKIPLLSNLRLVGGTSLALQIGHRKSDDLDFFGTLDDNMVGIQLMDELRERGFLVEMKMNSKTIKIFMINNIKVDIVTLPYAWIQPPIEINNVKLAGMKDIAAMKLAAITNGGTRKDFIDLYFLLQHFSFSEMFKFYTTKYPDYTSFTLLRSLTYFDDAELNPMPKMFIDVNWDTIKTTIEKMILDTDFS